MFDSNDKDLYLNEHCTDMVQMFRASFLEKINLFSRMSVLVCILIHHSFGIIPWTKELNVKCCEDLWVFLIRIRYHQLWNLMIRATTFMMKPDLPRVACVCERGKSRGHPGYVLLGSP